MHGNTFWVSLIFPHQTVCTQSKRERSKTRRTKDRKQIGELSQKKNAGMKGNLQTRHKDTGMGRKRAC